MAGGSPLRRAPCSAGQCRCDSGSAESTATVPAASALSPRRDRRARAWHRTPRRADRDKAAPAPHSRRRAQPRPTAPASAPAIADCGLAVAIADLPHQIERREVATKHVIIACTDRMPLRLRHAADRARQGAAAWSWRSRSPTGTTNYIAGGNDDIANSSACMPGSHDGERDRGKAGAPRR